MTTVSYVTSTSLSEGIDWDDLGGAQLQKLRDALLAAFTSRAALSELMEFGLGKNLNAIAGEGPLGHVVFEVLITARSEGWLFKLYEAARAVKPGNRKLIDFAKDPPIRAVKGQPGALESVPSTTDALQKAVPSAPPPTDVQTMLENLAEAANRVCRVEIAETFVGTGFLVGPSAVMTNWHVIRQGDAFVDRKDIVLRFDYRRSRGVVLHEGTVFRVESDWLVDTLPSSSLDREEAPRDEPSLDELDYAVLRVAGEPGSASVGGERAAPGASTRGWIKIPQGSPALTLESPLYILQHPLGEPLSIAHSTQAILRVNKNRTRVRYEVHTEAGSSGAPCFGKDWNLVALHHSGQPAVNPRWNQGIPIDVIRDRLMSRGKWGAIGN